MVWLSVYVRHNLARLQNIRHLFNSVNGFFFRSFSLLMTNLYHFQSKVRRFQVYVILYTVLIAYERVTVTIKRDGWPLSSCLVSSFRLLDYINQRCKKLFKFEILYILDSFYTIVCVGFHFVIQRQQYSRISCNSQFRGYVLLIQ